jgi:recombinational DNA repair protein (RecF pathway)
MSQIFINECNGCIDGCHNCGLSHVLADFCDDCGEQIYNENYISLKDGGMLCRECAEMAIYSAVKSLADSELEDFLNDFQLD